MTIAALAPTVDRRSAPRAAALRSGRLMLTDGLGPEVLIVDVSASGALVRLRAPAQLPQDLVLIDRHLMVAHRAMVVRRKELDVGLKFLRSLNLNGLVSGPLVAAKAWCLQTA